VSFRARLLTTSLATLAVGLGVLVFAGNVLLSKRVSDEGSALLRTQAEAQIAALTVTPSGRVIVRETPNDPSLDRGSWILARRRVVERPRGAPRALDRVAVELGRRGRATERDGPGNVVLRAQPVFEPGSRSRAGAVVVARSGAPVERLRHQVLAGSVVISLLVFLAGSIAIRNALDGALRPVVHMTASAEDWSEHDLDRRFGLGPPRDELTGLAATLDGLLARIAASRRHEQRFASEVAHELRTPIAGLRGRAELALAAVGPDAAKEREEALQSVVTQTDRIDRAVDALLAIARRDLEGSGGTVDLAELAAEVDGVAVITRAPLPAAEGEPDIVRRALAPLVDNARRHARNGVTLRLWADDGLVSLAVCDDGPGLDAALGERAFDPGVRGSDDPAAGVGLGLPLARRLARSCGGDVVIGQGSGGCFVLQLPVR
jgi:signal transduction histidine kinase